MSSEQDYASMETEYRVQSRSLKRANTPQRRRTSQKRRGAAPTSFNGMHRRRSKKMSW